MDEPAPINLIGGEPVLKGRHRSGPQFTVGVSKNVDRGGCRVDPALAVAARYIETFTIG